MLRRLVQQRSQLRQLVRDPRFVSTSLTPSDRGVTASEPSTGSALESGPLGVRWGFGFKISQSGFSSALSQQEADADDGDSVSTKLPKTTSAYTKKMQRLVRDGKQLYKVVRLFDAMKSDDVPQDTRSYTIIIRAYAKAGDMQKVTQLFNEMQENGIKPDVLVWNTYMHAHARTGDLDGALEVFEKMKESDVEPTAVSYRSLIGVCSAAKNLPKARELFDELMAKVDDHDLRNYNGLLDVLANCVDHQTGQELLDEAHKLLERAKGQDLKPDVHTYQRLIKLCGKGGLKKEALEYLATAKTAEGSKRLSAYDIMMESFAEVEGLTDEEVMSELIALFKHMVNNDVKPSGMSYKSALDVYTKRGNTRGALEFLDKLAEEGIHKGPSARNAKLECIARMGADGETTPEETRKMATDIIDNVTGSLTVNGYRAWLTICHQSLDLEGAKKCFEGYKSNVRVPEDEMVELMVKIYLGHEKLGQAMELLNSQEYQTLTQIHAMFEYLTEHKDSEKAAEVHQMMQKSGVKPNEEVQNLMSQLQLA